MVPPALGSGREQYEKQVLAQTKRNTEDVDQFNATFQQDMLSYTTLFASLVAQLRTIPRCDTCADPWQVQKNIIGEVRKLNNRFGFVIDRQLAIGNNNPAVINVSQNYLAQKLDLDQHLDHLLSHPQKETIEDQKKFNTQLAKLEQTIQLNVAVAPRKTNGKSLNLVRASYASEDIDHDDDPMYTAEINTYLEAETQMVDAQVKLIDAELTLWLTQPQTPSSKQTRDLCEKTFRTALVHWQTIRERAKAAEQSYEFVIIPRDVLEPHTDLTTEPPSIVSSDRVVVDNQAEFDRGVIWVHETTQNYFVPTCDDIQEKLNELVTLDLQRHSRSTSFNNGLYDESRTLRETIRANRAQLLVSLRKFQFVVFALKQFPNKNNKQTTVVSDKDYFSFFRDFTQSLQLEHDAFAAKIQIIVWDFQKENAIMQLAARRVANVTLDKTDTKLAEKISAIRLNRAAGDNARRAIWQQLEIWENQRQTYFQTLGVDLFPKLASNDVEIENNWTTIQDQTDFEQKQIVFFEMTSQFEKQNKAFEIKLKQLQADLAQQQVPNVATNEAQMQTLFEEKQQIADMQQQIIWLQKVLVRFAKQSPRVKRPYVTNGWNGRSITLYLLKENAEMTANLDYYRALATAADTTYFLANQMLAPSPDVQHATKSSIRAGIQKAIEQRSERDTFAKEKLKLKLDVLEEASSLGFEYEFPGVSTVNIPFTSIDMTEEQLTQFKRFDQQQQQSLQQEKSALIQIAALENKQHANANNPTERQRFKAELESAKQNLTLAPRIAVDPLFDAAINTMFVRDVCKTHLVFGSEDENKCEEKQCALDPSSLECKTLFEKGAKRFQDECKDVHDCEIALDLCFDENKCQQEFETLQKDDVRNKDYCSQYAAVPTIQTVCETTGCKPTSSDNVCIRIRNNFDEAKKRIDVKQKNIVSEIPQLAFPQANLLEITTVANNNQPQDAELNAIVTMLTRDLANGTPRSIAKIGTFMNDRWQTLQAMRKKNIPELQEAVNVWSRWIQETAEVLQQRCTNETWQCMAKADCVNNACATIVDKTVAP